MDYHPWEADGLFFVEVWTPHRDPSRPQNKVVFTFKTEAIQCEFVDFIIKSNKAIRHG
jgi:hypothetical protein